VTALVIEKRGWEPKADGGTELDEKRQAIRRQSPSSFVNHEIMKAQEEEE